MSTTLVNTTFQVDAVIEAWLNETRETKSGSAKTQLAYRTTLLSYRAALVSEGLDLDSMDTARLVEIAQQWAGQRAANAKAWNTGKPVADSTYNQRLAVVSSFYSFVQEHLRLRGVERSNPISLTKRRKVQAYASAEPLEPETIEAAFALIDRSTEQGKRDYALLAVMIGTGRRADEIASLRWQHVRIVGKLEAVTLHFEHCKNAKKMRDTLEPETGAVFLEHIRSFYGHDLAKMDQEAPVWMSFSRQNYGHAISIHTLSDLCEASLGTSKVHVTRHTFAYISELEGSTLSDIQHRLGHERIETTATYLKAVKSSVNPYAQRVAARIGVKRYAGEGEE